MKLNQHIDGFMGGGENNMPSYIKKDENHDVLGYPINPEKLDIPEKITKSFIYTLSNGKKVIWVPDKGNLQCAKCLYVLQLLAYPDDGGKQRKFYTTDSCGCNRI
jgi:hypothetical protein